MYQRDNEARQQRRRPDGPGRISPETRARHALTRLEQALSNAPPDVSLDADRLSAALRQPLADPALEGQRRFALGWLAWLSGDPAAARAALTGVAGARSAYWLARARLALGEAEALTDYEQQMRSFQGSPQATCWFVDLLWRAGRHDRAGQVWKSVRAVKRIAACEEAILLDARALIVQDDLAAAEKLLKEATLRNGVLQAERHLLLAWLGVALRKAEVELPARLLLPASTVEAWRGLLRRNPPPTFEALLALPLSPPIRAWVQAQHGRATGGPAARLRELLAQASGIPKLIPSLRYSRACLGDEDFAALLAALPGPFLAPRCRLWATLARFCRGETAAQEALTLLQQAEPAGHGPADLPSWRELIRTLAEGGADPASLWRKATELHGPLARNHRRVAVEAALRSGKPDETLRLLAAWGQELEGSEEPLRKRVGRIILRSLVEKKSAPDDGQLVAAAGLLGSPEWADLVRLVLAPGAELTPPLRAFLTSDAVPAASLCLRAFDAATRSDVPALLPLLEPSAGWQRFSAPPVFLCRALASVPSSDRWRDVLNRWLRQWSASPQGQALAAKAGLVPLTPDSAAPPAGVDPALWLLHQAGLALERSDALAALTWVRRARSAGLQSLDEPRRAIVDAALPDLERLARCGLLAQITCLDARQPPKPARLLAEFCDLLSTHPGGQEVLDTAARGDMVLARERLGALAEKPGLPPRLAHHLALVYLRAALFFERQERDDQAAPCWRRAWRCWMSWAGPGESASVALLIDHLLGLHRARLRDLLARNAVSRARPLWELMQAIPAGEGPSAALLRERLARFRDELATDFLLDTREAMRHGNIPQGWRVDYEQGLARLRRLLSLDRDNRQLLIALVEMCADWFLDLYDLRDAGRLRDEVDRYTPFCLQLARALGRPGEPFAGEVAAKAALAEFCKFRAFVTDDPERKRALYREALAFNPANENVRDLLGNLEGRS